MDRVVAGNAFMDLAGHEHHAVTTRGDGTTTFHTTAYRYDPATGNTQSQTFSDTRELEVSRQAENYMLHNDGLLDRVFQGAYTVPPHVFAESCPTCDENAMEVMHPGFVSKYPRGWQLIACRRHAAGLQSQGKDFLVGGVIEARKTAANRYYSRRKTIKSEKAAEQRAATAATTAGAPPTTPPSTPTSSTSSTPITSAENPTDPCPICVEDKPNFTLDCNHSFCIPCLTHWQQNSTDQKLVSWLNSSSMLLRCYPILAANLKSRFTCPMCRAQSQYTHQSRRKRKMQNKMKRGEDWLGGSARTRRGGVGGRARRQRERLEREEEDFDCDEALFRMPVVRRL